MNDAYASSSSQDSNSNPRSRTSTATATSGGYESTSPVTSLGGETAAGGGGSYDDETDGSGGGGLIKLAQPDKDAHRAYCSMIPEWIRLEEIFVKGLLN